MTDTGVLGKIYEIETGASKGIHRKNNFLRQIQEHPRISIDRLERQENPDIKNYKSIRRQNFKTDYRSTQILRQEHPDFKKCVSVHRERLSRQS